MALSNYDTYNNIDEFGTPNPNYVPIMQRYPSWEAYKADPANVAGMPLANAFTNYINSGNGAPDPQKAAQMAAAAGVDPQQVFQLQTQSAQIRSKQGGNGLFGIGMDPQMAGLFAAAVGGAGLLGAGAGGSVGAGFGDLSGGLSAASGTSAGAAGVGGGMSGIDWSSSIPGLSSFTDTAMSSPYTFGTDALTSTFGDSASNLFGPTGGLSGVDMTGFNVSPTTGGMFNPVDTGLGNFQLGAATPGSLGGMGTQGFGASASDMQTLFGADVTNPSAGALGQFVDPATGQINWNMPGASQALNSLMGNSGMDMNMLQRALSSIKNGLGSNLGGLLGKNTLGGIAGSTVPGLMALNYANSQPGINTASLQGIQNQMGANTAGFTQAAIDPFQKNIAAGYGDLLQSQGQRGIRGSSFGDTDIANYIATTGRSLSNAGANAYQGSLANQGTLAAQIAALTNQGQTTKNQLFGRAFDVLGRGLNPQSYMGNINLGGTGTTGG